MNTIIEKIQRSWQLFERSVRVLREQPKLLVFPLVTGLVTAVIALFFLVPVGLALLAPHWVAGGKIQSIANSIGFLQLQNGPNFGVQIHALGSILLAGVYLLNMFVASMASVAFSYEIFEALNRRPVSISRGIAAACARWKSILLWSLLAGTVGLIIRAIEDRLSFVGRLVAGLIGLAWSTASIFAIPGLARDPAFSNPFAILSRSVQTIKRTWGEALVGYVGMQGTNVLFVLGSIVFWIVAGLAAIGLSNAWILLPLGVGWLLALIVYGYLASIASRVYLCALFLYASEGAVPGEFYDASMMNMGWKLKKK
ncbi:conserved membrane hypothetical protein [Verrucomicrobia bacterium]|nr:conserved membrane hypothetical protein [Verrucomicrobiota bacterium]